MEGDCGHGPELEALRRENAQLRSEVAEVRKLLEEALRASKRQAAPFSKGAPKTDPKTPGRKPGDAYGLKAHRERPSTIDEVIPVDLPEACPCGGTLEFIETVRQFQTEIPRQAIHRRFDLAVGRCRRCGWRRPTRGSRPSCGAAARSTPTRPAGRWEGFSGGSGSS